MHIETTLNLKHETTEIIKLKTNESRRTVSQLISKILNKIINKEYLDINIDNSVKYQSGKTKWKKLHVKFSIKDYEKAIDLRKFTKKSVSLIISEGIEKYLEEVVQEYLESRCTDNYPSEGYFVSCLHEKGRNKFKIIWGKPNKFEENDNYLGKTKKISELSQFLK